MHSKFPHLNNLWFIARRDSPESKAYEASPAFKAWRAAIETAHLLANTHRDPEHTAYKKALEAEHAAGIALHATPEHIAYHAMLAREGLTEHRHVAHS